MTQTSPSSDPARQERRIKSVSRMKEIMTDYYIRAKEAENTAQPVAWITSGGPVEPLIAMDIIPVYPENHGAMIGASKMGADLCAQAEDMGYSRDLCSYAKADLACAQSHGGPIGGLPRPDLLICCNNICSTVVKWYEIQARAFDIPLFILDTPMNHTAYPQAARDYVRDQIQDCIAFLEGVTGKKLDHDRMQEVGSLSVQAQRLWDQILQTAAHAPSPMSAFDAFFHLALIVTLRGTSVCVEYYRQLLDEMHQRIASGIGAVPREDYRLLWDNLPIWYRTKWLSTRFADHNACLVADTYTSAWCSSLESIDDKDFLGSMAEAYSQIYLNLGLDRMAEQIIAMMHRYRADGLVMHSNRSCKPYSLGQYDIQRLVRERTGCPVLILEADMVDERLFSESQAQTRIDAFMEMIRSRRPTPNKA